MDISIEEREIKNKASEMIFDTINAFKVTLPIAICICIKMIDFMIIYNPKPINPSKQKQDYHKFWDDVTIELKIQQLNLIK